MSCPSFIRVGTDTLLNVNKLKPDTSLETQGFNTYDSLGETYMENGDKNLAIQNYKKSLELNPKNTGAVEKLKKLEAA